MCEARLWAGGDFELHILKQASVALKFLEFEYEKVNYALPLLVLTGRLALQTCSSSLLENVYILRSITFFS